MAVFTELTSHEVEAFVAHLHAGALIELVPIGAGIENTNYFVTTSAGRCVLTLFERLTARAAAVLPATDGAPGAARLPVPEPRADAAGELVHSLRGKPAALCTRLPGAARRCARRSALRRARPRAGALARRRQRISRWRSPTCAGSPGGRPRRRGCGRSSMATPRTARRRNALPAAARGIAAYAGLPRGAVHADLFRDNALFDGDGREHLSGCVDFYFAGVDTLLFDLAVCVNDWCLADDSGRIDDARAAALLGAYGERRALSAAERRLFPGMLRAAALRFWLSRLADRHLPREAALLQPKDPRHFERLLRERVAQPWHPPR